MRFLRHPISIALALASIPTWAQIAPDAGQVLQEVQSQEISPQSRSADVQLPEQPLLDESMTGGQTVTVETVRFEGNSAFDTASLEAALAFEAQDSYTLSELRRLANRISQFYRNQGFPFARAYLPAQRLGEGTLTIGVLEGMYGQIQTQGPLAEGVQPFLDHGLQAGDLIESDPLERTTLIIGDLPGVTVSPVMRPGDETGQGNLDMQAEPDSRINGSLSVDNHGNRYTGAHRVMANVNVNRLLTLGDELSMTAMYTDEQLGFGSVRYERPLGYSGLRGFGSFVKTDYELGTSEFDAADISGIVDITSLGASYPLRRSQITNIALNAQLQYKDITDENGAADTEASKNIHALPVTISFDHRDSLGGGGITYGALTASVGELDIGDALQRAIDEATAKTDGSFAKLHLDAARIQNLPGNFSGYLRVVGQWANTNLDSAEGMTLGGPRGVRAYPQGEASGDMGLLAQAELRYSWQNFTPYVFFDRGRIHTNADRWDEEADNTRSLAGAGAGLRVNYADWSADIAAAWRTQGGEPRSDTEDDKPNVWASLQYRF
ncbi:ShlB/FhaC/HecB family hemolysin secretion/activation protein [Vreelandella aquamarina]|uniref:ShlB/FhaC/HecB family hemolysin secretion/activation protein n=1 Tax=Vreelandella aquamarina TaxID=77097 RepID=UPI00384CAF21